MAGLEGSGQDLLLKVAAGLVRPIAGSVVVAGRDLTDRPYPDYASSGVAYLPSSRLEEALIPGLTIAEHALLLGGGTALRLDRAAAQAQAGRRIRDYRIKGLPETAVEELSGGNQQRLLLSQLPAGSRLLLLDNPTRGLDMESGRWVWQRLVEHARNGAAILFASPEIDEILAVAVRVLVFFNGRLVLDVPATEAVRGRLGQAIAGVTVGSPS